MPENPISSTAGGIGDDALVRATGRPSLEWFALLDAAGAAGWAHQVITAWLRDTHAVPDWWCQMITVGFEQASGRRAPGQRADGSFEVSASATLALPQPAALDALVRAVSAELGPPTSERRESRYATARWTRGADGSILATANPEKAGKTSVSLTHQHLPDAAHVAPARAAMRGWLDAAAR